MEDWRIEEARIQERLLSLRNWTEQKHKTLEDARRRGEADEDDAYGGGKRIHEANQLVDSRKKILEVNVEPVQVAVLEVQEARSTNKWSNTWGGSPRRRVVECPASHSDAMPRGTAS